MAITLIKKIILKSAVLVIISQFILIPFSFSHSNLDKKSGDIIWKSEFQSGPLSGWEITDNVKDEDSNWFIDKGYLIQDTDIGSKSILEGTNIVYLNSKWSDCVIRVNMICTDDDYIGILFRYNDNNNYYRFILSSENEEIRVDKKKHGEFYQLAVLEKEWEFVKFNVTIFLKENNIKIYLNDKEYFNLNDNQFSIGNIGFTSISNLGSFFDDITVYSSYQIAPEKIIQGFTRGPYLQSVLGDSAVVMWKTSLPANSIIEYGLSQETIISNINEDPVTSHEIKLKGLEPESEYIYRVKSGELTSDWYSFRTSIRESTPFSFIVYGDNQMNFIRHNEICRQILKHDFNFLISTGDVVQYGPRDDWDIEFFNPLKDILHSKPIYAAIGNHEKNSINYYLNFSNPNAEHENYYSFKYGNSFFIIIDNPKAAYPEKEYYTDFTVGSPQYKWLDNELSSDEAQNSEWLFVVSHIPSYVAGSQDYYKSNKKYLVPLFEKYNVDISFSGHVHGFEKGLVNNVNYILTAGGGGPQNKKNMSALKKFPLFKTIYNFCSIDIKNNILLLRVYNNYNELIDELKIEH